MKPFNALSIVLLAASASASSVITVLLTKPSVANNGTLKGTASADRARAARLMSQDPSGPTNVPGTNQYVQYTTSVGIGSPPTQYKLTIDTGSSNTFVVNSTYARTPTSINTTQTINVSYSSGNVTGLVYLDQVTLAPNLVITNQTIGDVLPTTLFQGADGVLGVGPVDLTRGTVTPVTSPTIPTVMNNLLSQRLIENEVLGIYFAPPTYNNDTNGALTYGGADPNLYQGNITYTPVTKTQPAASYWGINISSCTYGAYTNVFNLSTAGIFDSGTALVLLADDFFTTYMNAIPGAAFDNSTGLISMPPNATQTLLPLKFQIAGETFTMDATAQLIPMDQNAAWGGDSWKQYGVVTQLGKNSGRGLDFIFGMKFLERFYAVFDTDNNQVGLAHTNNTFAT